MVLQDKEINKEEHRLESTGNDAGLGMAEG